MKLTEKKLISEGWPIHVWRHQENGEYSVMISPPTSASGFSDYPSVTVRRSASINALMEAIETIEPIHKSFQDDVEGGLTRVFWDNKTDGISKGTRVRFKTNIEPYVKKGYVGMVSAYLPKDKIFSVHIYQNLEWVTFTDEEEFLAIIEVVEDGG